MNIKDERKRAMKVKTCVLAVSLVAVGVVSHAANVDLGQGPKVKGVVFWDKNGDGVRNTGEAGIPNVCVSNGKEVTKTKGGGSYCLPAYDDMVVFVVKPAGWMTPVDGNNVPRFSYIHKPAGSPPEIQKYRGIEPTGPLPASVDFPLYRASAESDKFEAMITGDTQVYNDREINYVRNSLVKEVRGKGARFCISMGDNVGDDLALYPRYLEVMGEMGIPVYYVPGNHDMDFDTTSDVDSLDTYKSYIGATYFSFNYGKVHFVVLDSVKSKGGGDYQGHIDDVQMQWLANDLAYVPQDHLVVLNMHIPIVSDVDRLSPKHQVDNREQLYQLLEGRKVVSLGGHTHTVSHFMPGDQLEGWGQATPIAQTIVGAACGSWWSGDFDSDAVPMSTMRCGAPRGHMIFGFNGCKYRDMYAASGKPADKQMSVSFLSEDFEEWFDNITSANPTVTINDLEDRDRLPVADLETTLLVANVWGASMNARVAVQFDGGPLTKADWDLDAADPYALPLELYILRGVPGFRLFDKEGTGQQFGPGMPVTLPEWLWTTGGRSTHLWVLPMPTDLQPGAHTATIWAIDEAAGKKVLKETKVFEVVE
jgi:hypothetical protein